MTPRERFLAALDERIGYKKLLNEAVGHELYASNFYKYAASCCQKQGLFGAQKFFENESADELKHYYKLRDFFNDRGDEADMPQVDEVDFKEGQAVMRELVHVKIKADARTRSEIMQICDIFRAEVVNVAHDALIVEVTGDEGKTAAFLRLVEAFGILELARTGQLAMRR